MAFDIMSLFEDDKFVSPGSIGGKIKKFREMRGWSQKELGIRCGFSPSTADVRIAQYEKNKKIPREKALKDLADALGIEEYALFDADLMVYNRMYQALFDLEDFHGLHPVKKDYGYYLEFSGPTKLHPYGVTREDYRGFLEKWYEMRQKYMPNDGDSAEEKKNKATAYALWRGEYPENVAKETTERMNDLMRMHRLQAEMDELNAKMKSKDELAKIDKALEPVMPEVKSSYTPIQYESEFIYLVKEMLESGISLEQYTPEEKSEIDFDYMHILSIKTAEILSSSENMHLYARLVCYIETIQQCGINVFRTITSRNSELFITYKCPISQSDCFDNLRTHWDDLIYILERKPHWAKQDLQPLEDKLRADITGKNDVEFLVA